MRIKKEFMMLIILKCYTLQYNDELIYNFVDVMLTMLTDLPTYLMFTVQQNNDSLSCCEQCRIYRHE